MTEEIAGARTANPWDKAFNTGFEWQDELVTQIAGKSVQVSRALSPCGPDFVRALFPDGSVFYFGFDASSPVERALRSITADQATDAAEAGLECPDAYVPEVLAAEAANESDAHQVYGPMVEALYADASLTETDTDL